MKIQFGRGLRTVNEKDLFAIDVIPTWVDIPYDIVKKYEDFITELCEQSGTIGRFNEAVYKDIVAYATELINPVKEEMEDTDMGTTTINETTNNTNEMEETTMTGTVKGNVELAVEEMMSKFVEAKENIKVNVGETAEEYIERVDDSVDVMKGALGNVLDVLDKTLGYTILKDSILEIMEAGTTGKSSKKDLFKMAKRCRELLEEEIDNLEFWGDQESLAKAVQLKALTEADRDKSVFEAFVSGCIHIAKRVARKLRKWFQVDNEKSVVGAICRSISGFTKAIRAGVKIVWNTAKFAVSFIIAGAVKVGDFIVRTFKSLFIKMKEWATVQYQKLSKEDAEDDFAEEDFIIDEEVVIAD